MSTQQTVFTNVISTLIAAGVLWIASSQHDLTVALQKLTTTVTVHEFRLEALEGKEK